MTIYAGAAVAFFKRLSLATLITRAIFSIRSAGRWELFVAVGAIADFGSLSVASLGRLCYFGLWLRPLSPDPPWGFRLEFSLNFFEFAGSA